MKRLLTEWRENVYSTKYCCYRARTFISRIVLDFGPLCTKVYQCDENACEKMCAQKRIPFELVRLPHFIFHGRYIHLSKCKAEKCFPFGLFLGKMIARMSDIA